MNKKLAVLGCTAFGALSILAPFSAQKINAGALSPTIDSENLVCYNFGNSNAQCVSGYYGDSIVNGVLGVLPSANENGSRQVFHALNTMDGAGSSGLVVLEYSNNSVMYALSFGSTTYTEIQIYINGYYPARYFDRYIEYIVGAPDSNTNLIYDCYFAYTIGNTSSLSIYNPSPVDLGDSVVENFTFDYPVQFDNLANNAIVYVQGWHNFKFNSSTFSLTCNTTPYYEDWGYVNSLVGSQLNKPVHLDILGSIISSANSFLNIDIFPGFSFKSLMYLVFAVTFFGFILRTWLGG